MEPKGITGHIELHHTPSRLQS